LGKLKVLVEGNGFPTLNCVDADAGVMSFVVGDSVQGAVSATEGTLM